MVTKWGLSDRLGPLSYTEDEGEVFLGRSVTQHKNLGDDTARIIDEEVRNFIDRNYGRAETILKDHMSILHMMAEALMKYETIDSNQIDALMEGKVPPPPEDWSDTSDSKPDDKSGSSDVREPRGDRPIGGPASEH
jgi:cell division protease FtsH